MLTLSALLAQFPHQLSRIDRGRVDKPLSGITADSRAVKADSLFAAIRGTTFNGEDYIEAAKAAGAAAILTSNTLPPQKGIAHLACENERLMLAKLAACFYPAAPEMAIVAITGTNGKTSTAEFFRQLYELSGQKAASIGTMGLTTTSLKQIPLPALNTSPDPVLLHRALQKLSDRGADAVALEASSHGLDQFRMDGVKLRAAAFTNLTRDHLDYHKTEKAYFEAKKRLFGHLLPRGGFAVLNADSDRFTALHKICTLRKHHMLSYGMSESADYQIRQLIRHPNGLEVRLKLHGQRIEANLGLIGDFQVMNLLAAIGLAEGCGIDGASLTPLLHQLRPIRGRMEQAAAGVYVDYAHTPDALERALQSLRAHCARGSKLHVVFGCGGNRDAGKRPLMGKIASELADSVIITDDNPRHESAAEIRQHVLAGCREGNATTIADRRAAIAAALSAKAETDLLLIAGKGHENYQIIGDETLDFDDAQVVRELVTPLP